MHGGEARSLRWVVSLALVLSALLLGVLAGCASVAPAATSTPAAAATVPVGSPSPDPAATPVSLSAEQLAALSSLERVDDHPLYVLHYAGDYPPLAAPRASGGPAGVAGNETCSGAWGCALFAAMGDTAHPLYGRNFDWRASPAVLLFVEPPGR